MSVALKSFRPVSAAELFGDPRLTMDVYVERDPAPAVVEGVATMPEYEDSGMAMGIQVDVDTDGKAFVWLRSWAEDKDHSAWLQFAGRRVRITVEAI